MILSTLLAETPPAQSPGIADFVRGPFVPMIIIMIGFIYVTNRMQKKKIRDQEQKLKTLKTGDKIVTTSGILGVVITVKEKAISIRSADSKFEITKAAVAEILERGDEAKES